MSSRINVPGAAIAYRLDGRSEASTVMFAHALAADVSVWDDNVSAFERTYRTLRYDMRGHGSSSNPPGPYSAGLLVDDAVALLDALGIDRVHFVGLSLGAVVGGQLAARYPNRVHSLSICSAVNNHSASAVVDEDIAIVRASGVEAIVERTIGRWFTPGFGSTRREAIDRMRGMISRTRANGFIGCASTLRETAYPAVMPRMSRIPTMIVAGSDDPGADLNTARAMCSRSHCSELHIIPNAAVMLNVEQPDEFSSAILGFLAELRPLTSVASAAPGD